MYQKLFCCKYSIHDENEPPNQEFVHRRSLKERASSVWENTVRGWGNEQGISVDLLYDFFVEDWTDLTMQEKAGDVPYSFLEYLFEAEDASRLVHLYDKGWARENCIGAAKSQASLQRVDGEIDLTPSNIAYMITLLLNDESDNTTSKEKLHELEKIINAYILACRG